MNKNAWIPVGGSPTVLDFTKCKYFDDFHQELKKAFGFPAYYGKNASALWDLLRDFFDDRTEEIYWEVQIFGWNEINRRFDSDFLEKYWSVFDDISEEYPFVKFLIKD